MRPLQKLILLALAVVIVYAGYQYGKMSGLLPGSESRFILNDIYSLVMLPDGAGGCRAAVGYREKHVIGTLVAEPVKKMLCEEYYFQDKPETRYRDVTIVLVRLNTDEYHWILETQLVTPL